MRRCLGFAFLFICVSAPAMAADGTFELLPPECKTLAKRFEFPVKSKGKTVQVPILVSLGRNSYDTSSPSLEVLNVRIGVTDFEAHRYSVTRKSGGTTKNIHFLRLEKTTEDPDRRAVIEGNSRSQRCINGDIPGASNLKTDRTTRAYYCHSIVKAGYKGIPEMEISQNTGIDSKYPDGICKKYPAGRCPVGRILDVYPDGTDPMAHTSGSFIRVNWEGSTTPGHEGNLRIFGIDGYKRKTIQMGSGYTREDVSPNVTRAVEFTPSATLRLQEELRRAPTATERSRCAAKAGGRPSNPAHKGNR